MKKADYQMLSGICMALGTIFSIFGLAYDIMMARSGVFSFYFSSSILIFGGIALVVIGWGLSWRARQEK